METMKAMRAGADAMKGIHGSLYDPPAKRFRFQTNTRNPEKVDTIMDEIRDQMAMSNDISDAIARPAFGNEIDEGELLEELEALEQEELDNKLIGVDVPSQRVPTAQGTRSLDRSDNRTRAETKVQGGRGRGSRVACFASRDGDLIVCVRGVV
jgi:charged multivesicular body protein 4